MTEDPKAANQTTVRLMTESYPSVGEFFLGLERTTGEPVDPDDVQHWIQEHTQAFTLREGQGFWNGKTEPVLCILIAGLERERLVELGAALARAFGQHSVGLLHENAYIRILPVPERKPLDQFRLSRFKQLLDEGTPFEGLPSELKNWWRNRY